MKNVVLVLIVAVLAVCVGGCSDREAVERLNRAEQVMEEHSDSALMLIQGVDPSRLRNDKDRALYALLRTQALVKNDSVIASDSLIRTAVDYYTRHPRASYLMKSAFYLGEVQRNLGNLTSAVKSATQAYDLACQADDAYWIAKSAEQLMFIYNTSFNEVEAQKYAYIAAENYKKSGHRLNYIYSLVDICVCDKNLERYNIALNKIDSIINILPSSSQDPLIAYSHIIRLPICLELKNYDEAFTSLKELLKRSNTCPLPTRVYVYQVELYRKIGNLEKAKNLLDSISKMIYNVRDRGIILNEYYNLCKAEQRYEEALKYKDSLVNIQNDEVVKLVNADIALSQKEYYAVNYHSEEQKSKSYRNLIIEILIFSVIVILIILGVLKILVTRKNEKIENKIKDILILSSQLKDKESEQLRILDALTDKEKESSSLYKEQWATLNMLCHEYFEKGDSEKTRVSILKSVEERIKELNSPKSQKSLENSVNKYMHNIILRLRKECDLLKFNEADVKFLTLCCAGFSPRAICLLMNITLNNYYAKRRRLIERIQRHSEDLAEEIKSYLSDKQ